MGEYIEREVALRELESLGITKNMKAHRKIKAIPEADVVEVVRCKDCEFRREVENCGTYKGKKPKICIMHCKPTSETYFCGDGIRKGGVENDR